MAWLDLLAGSAAEKERPLRLLITEPGPARPPRVRGLVVIGRDRVGDRRDDSHASATAGTTERVDLEDALKKFGPPHPDHPHTWVDDLTRYAEALRPETRAKVLGENVRRIYKF